MQTSYLYALFKSSTLNEHYEITTTLELAFLLRSTLAFILRNVWIAMECGMCSNPTNSLRPTIKKKRNKKGK